MRRIIGIGETILDIIFKNQKPVTAVPGGSVFNSLISLGRLGLNTTFISETGNDRAGKIILDFLHENGVDNKNVCIYDDGRTPISLAWLNDNNDAEYEFYKNYPKARLDIIWPKITADDIIMMGSYFVLNPVLRDKTSQFIKKAHESGALIYYDFNFRKSHAGESLKLYPDILDNIEHSDIVRGSAEDIENMFMLNLGIKDAKEIYTTKISSYCHTFIHTDAYNEVTLFTKNFTQSYPVFSINTISTIGAGDNFNAGIIFGLIKENVYRDNLNNLTPGQWKRIIQYAIDFSAHVCQSLDNYISKEFATSVSRVSNE